MLRILVSLLLLFASPLKAHELWLEPEEFSVSTDGKITVEIVNGQNFDGTSLAFIKRRMVHFSAVLGPREQDIEGRSGDIPAASFGPLGDGLHVLSYVASPLKLTYSKAEKFEDFIREKDLGQSPAAALLDRLPEATVQETYWRYSKSLVSVGSGAGTDRRFGLETELVALTNPYTDPDIPFRVALFYKNKPRVDAQIEVFERAPDGTVTSFMVRTDNMGTAQVPSKRGHDYMLDAVVLRLPESDAAREGESDCESLWANLTFSIPH